MTENMVESRKRQMSRYDSASLLGDKKNPNKKKEKLIDYDVEAEKLINLYSEDKKQGLNLR